MAQLQALAHSPRDMGENAKLQQSCNGQIAYSCAAAGENRRSPTQGEPRAGDRAPPVDPLAMSLACVSGPPLVAVEPAASNPSVTAAGGALDAVLASEVLQRVAWGGDRRRGVARLELGGDLAGAVVVVRGEGREVALELTLPRGGTAGELPERLAARLAARGLVVRELVVR
jgi:hypothetical protein